MPGVLDRLHPGLVRRVKESGWRELSPIQEAAIPVILEGHDCVIQAPTAGGKTEAVLFPALTQAARSRVNGVRVLYLAPLRALLNNLEDRALLYAEDCGLHAFKWHGDVNQKDKIDAMQLPPELLLTTPESLEAILLRKAEWARFFSGLECLIIDEAHNFAAGDRGGHVVSLIERLEHGARRRPQRIALSATVSNIEAFTRWLAGGHRDPGKIVDVGACPQTQDFEIALFDEDADSDELPAEDRSAFRQFVHLYALVEGKRSIVFVGSRRKAERLAEAFIQFDRGQRGQEIKIRTHHSAVSKFFREEAERLIQIANEQGINGIISTSTLELGIDIGELDSVVQLGALASPSAFLQRVGRTGRRPGRPQHFRGLCTKKEDLVLIAAVIRLGLRGISEAIPLHRRCFHLLAHQLICLSLQQNGISPDRAWEILSGCHCFSGIRRSELELLIEHMNSQGYLREADGLLLPGDKAEKHFLGAGWRRLFAVFDSAPLYDVYENKNQVGTLDASFVEVQNPPFLFMLAARPWKAISVDHKRRVVIAQRSGDAIAPRWASFGGMDVPFETAQEAGRIFHEQEIPPFLDEEAAAGLRYMQQKNQGIPWEPGVVVLLLPRHRQIKLFTYAGDRSNRTLAAGLSSAGLGKAVADYRRVKIDLSKDYSGETGPTVRELLGHISKGSVPEQGSLDSVLKMGIRAVPFSPFSRCLPEELAKEAILERSYDCDGLKQFLSNCHVEVIEGAWT